jgi:uncharacterized protein with PQ loop repeat
MNQTLASIAVAAATIGTVAFLVPQTVKLIRTRDAEGVSATWSALGFVINAGWVVYLISQRLWVATMATLITSGSYLLVVWAINRAGREVTKPLMRAGLWGVLLAGVGVVAGWTPFGVALGLSAGVQLSPSLWTAYRAANPSGVSAGTWWIGLTEAILWGYYGGFKEDAGLVTFAVVAGGASVLMLARYYATRRRIPVLAASADG